MRRFWTVIALGASAFVHQTTPRPALTHRRAAPLVDRVLDTLEDAAMHLSRLGEEPVDAAAAPDDGRPTLLILGSGWASHALIKVVDASLYRVVVVSPRNHFVFTPMLASAAVGSVEYRSMTESVRSANPLVEFFEGSATRVDVEAKTVDASLAALGEPGDRSLRLQFDALVVAVGSRVADAVVPGAAAHCYKLKDCEDARRLREAIGERFERAARAREGAEKRDLTFVVVGGGATGVELAGELSDFVGDVSRLYPRLPADAPAVVLVHSGDELLPQFDEELRGEAARALRSRGVDVVLGGRVDEVRERELVLAGGEEIPCALAVWCAGTAPQPLIDDLRDTLPASAFARDGRLRVDAWLRVPGARDVFAVGDAAFCRPPGDAEPVPQTAQVAGQQGAFVARLLNRRYDLRADVPTLRADDASAAAVWLRLRGCGDAPTFAFLNLGLLAYVGGGEALSQLQVGDFRVGAYAGSAAYLLWRSVYIVKQVATRNRVLVTFDWIKTAIFGRDITRL